MRKVYQLPICIQKMILVSFIPLGLTLVLGLDSQGGPLRPKSTGSLALQPIVATVVGKVTDESGNGLPGVNVNLKGTSLGTITDKDGKYLISVLSDLKDAVLVFSFVGYTRVERKVDQLTEINVSLTPDNQTLGEVVVTALGIEKQSQNITYTTQKVAGTDLKLVPQTNAINSLSGRVAGLNLSRSAAGLGGSVKVLLRGSKSIQGNNQPLYVIDGVPLVNFTSENTNNSFTNTDSGDGISNLNPDDIETISVLKGPSAASLYGSQAANGVILITTKKGKSGVSTLNFSSSLTLDKIAYKPQLQNSYGQTAPGSAESWGAKITNAQDNISDFFKTGRTWVNSVGLTSGSQFMQTYLSYANTSANGIIEGNTLSKHNFTIRESARFLNSKLKADANINYIDQTINNNPIYGYSGTPLYGLYTFPRGLDFAPYKNSFSKLDPIRNLETQNWPFITQDSQNPYWVINKMLTANKRNRAIINLAAKYDITDWLSFQLRGNMDRTNDVNTLKYYAGTVLNFSGLNGRYDVSNVTTTQYYGDALLTFNKSFKKIQLNGVIGSSITDTKLGGENVASTKLYIPNVFTLQNMSLAPETYINSVSEQHRQLQAVFGNVSASFNQWLNVDLTARNDWSSSLSYTPNGSYFYPSAGLNLLLHQALKLPELISFAKLRASYAVVGNTVPIYVTNPVNYLAGGGNISFNNTAPFADLKPEKTKSLELGTEIHFLQNQLSLDLTYYNANTTNQFFSILVPPGTGYSRRFINGGNIQNSGVEVVLQYTSLPQQALNWRSTVNFTSNKNTVKELAPGVDQFLITDDINNYSSILKVGGSYGDLYGQVLKRDDKGRVVIGADGKPVVQGGERSFIGNSNPKFQLGWNNSFGYKNFSLSFLVDGKFGGKVLSLTEQVLDGAGVSKASGDARENGGVTVDGVLDGTETSVNKVDTHNWYSIVGGRQQTTGEYMYDATAVRLREASLSYSLPNTVLKGGFVKNLRLSVIGRNLVYFYKKAPYDPELSYSTGNGYSGVDIFSLPATRSIGVSLNASF